jgi:hypothetical protein
MTYKRSTLTAESEIESCVEKDNLRQREVEFRKG